MRKISILLLAALVVLFSGCGKIAQQVQEIDDSSSVQTSAPSAEIEELTAEKFVGAIQQIYSLHLANLTKEGTTQELGAEPASFQNAAVFANFSVSYDDTYAYWNYAIVTKNIGEVVEVADCKYRYFDKRTGLPFDKALNAFTIQDFNNIDYIQRVEIITGKYPTAPNKAVYTAIYYEKIVDQGDKYTISLYPNTNSQFSYIGWLNSPLEVTELNVVYKKSDQSGTQFISLIDSGQTYITEVSLEVNNSIVSGKGQAFYKSGSTKKIMVDMLLPGNSNKFETIYYIGQNSSLYTYTNLTSNLITALEDNSLWQFQDNNTYSNASSYDGTASQSKLGSRVQNLRLSSLGNNSSSQPKLNNSLTLKNFDGLTIEKINFSRRGIRVQNCTNVIINGRTYSSITNQLFYN